jgi:signal transduction histidine kinase
MSESALQADINDLRKLVILHSRLLEISVTLNSTLDIDRLLQFIVQSAAELVDSEEASILLIDENTQNLYVAASTAGDGGLGVRRQVPLKGSISGTIFKQDQPLILNELPQGDIRSDSQPFSVKARTFIGVPMRIRDEVTGVLEAMNKSRGVFEENDLRTLGIIASQAAVAISNARLLEALQLAYDDLGKLDKLKSDFIAIASHELRTPLGLILGYGALLQEQTSEKASELAGVVMDSALRMRSLIEDMTNMNLLQLRSGELELTTQSLQAILEKAQREVESLMTAKEQTLHLRRPDATVEARVDGPKLTLAITNLLNNALRFTENEGNIILRLERAGDEAWISVADDGMGIPADELDRIFEQFYQVEDHMTRRHEGMGLGLAIVKAVANAHNGRVWAESGGPGLGSQFTIAIPLG